MKPKISRFVTNKGSRQGKVRSQNLVEACLKDAITPGRRQSKTPILSRNVDQKSLETEFSITICRHTGDKWQSKTLFLSIFDQMSSIVDSAFDCRLTGVAILYIFSKPRPKDQC